MGVLAQDGSAVGYGLVVLGALFAGCGGRIDELKANEDSRDLPEASTGGAPTDVASDDSDSGGDPVGDTPVEDGPACPAVPIPSHPNLELRFSCGIHRADVTEYSAPVAAEEPCTVPFGELNTFAFELIGAGSELYDAVVRCGYVRYDNGTFVGERVWVEALNGAWCHDIALQSIELVDRMLLTDVAFVLEPLSASAAEQPLALEITGTQATGSGGVRVYANEPVCLYSAHRAWGAASCDAAPSTDTCTCPCDSFDFASEATLDFAEPLPD